MLELDGVTVRFGDTVALDGVDLGVARGEVVAVLGASGSGKSTLLRVVAGLQEPQAGSVRLAGRDLAHVPAHERRVGLMFQDYALFPHRNVGENVAFGLRMRGDLHAKAIRDRVDRVLEQVGLAGFERRPVNRLSGGEQQRVALARAIAPEPELLMLDEPLGSLDRVLRDRLLGELGQLFARLGVTVLYVTHDQAEAFALGTTVVLMRDGRVVQSGAPRDVWGAPADERAARFLGLVNVVPARVRDGVAITAFGPLGLGPAARGHEGERRIVLRPDAFVPPDGSGPAISGVVTARSFRGDHFVLVVATDAGPVLEVTARGNAVAEPGEGVSFGIDPAGVVVLGPE